jgi:hypothetical protein
MAASPMAGAAIAGAPSKHGPDEDDLAADTD